MKNERLDDGKKRGRRDGWSRSKAELAGRERGREKMSKERKKRTVEKKKRIRVGRIATE